MKDKCIAANSKVFEKETRGLTVMHNNTIRGFKILDYCVQPFIQPLFKAYLGSKKVGGANV